MRRIAAYRGDFDRDLSLFRELNSLYQGGTPAEELRRLEREALGGAANGRGDPPGRSKLARRLRIAPTS